MDVSVIIVTYNPGELVFACLDSLPQAAGDVSYEVIVVDNASQDGTPAEVERKAPQVQLIANTENRGFAAANNQGLARAIGRHALLLNPDTVLSPGTLAKMAAFLDNNEEAGIVGPRMVDGQGRGALSAYPPLSAATVLWSFLGLARLFPNRFSGRYRTACQQASAPFEVGWVQGSCLMLRRDLAAQIGGLDEGFFLFAEEPDLCERARKAGWRSYFLPTATFTHEESSTVARYVQVKVRNHHISALYYFRKRGREASVLALKMGFTLEFLMKSAVRLVQLLHGNREDSILRLRTYWAVLLESWRY